MQALDYDDIKLDDKFIKIYLTNSNNLIVREYPISLIGELSNKSKFFRNFLSPNFKGTDDIDLTNFKEESFNVIMKYLLTGIKPLITSDLDVKDITDLAIYLGLEEDVFEHLNFDEETLFDSALTKNDKNMVDKERIVRNTLFAEDSTEKDMRYIDEDYTLLRSAEDFGCNIVDGKIMLENSANNNWVRNALGNRRKCKICKQGGYDNLAVSYYDTCAKHKSYNLINPYYKIKKRGDYYTIGKPRPVNIKNLNDNKCVEAFNMLTYNIFDGIHDLENIVIAGGFARELLLPKGGRARHPDLDIFITTKNEEDANDIVYHILSKVEQHNIDNTRESRVNEHNSHIYMIRNENSITCYMIEKEHNPERDLIPTFNGNWEDGENVDLYVKVSSLRSKCFELRESNSINLNNRRFMKIQFILRLYNSITQVITGFDLDSSSVAYSPFTKQFYCTPRFIRSLAYGYNLADPERQSKNYHQRLVKYLKRGTAIALPGYSPDRCLKYISSLKKPTGMAKIINHFYNVAKTRNFTSERPDYSYGLIDTPFPLTDILIQIVKYGQKEGLFDTKYQADLKTIFSINNEVLKKIDCNKEPDEYNREIVHIDVIEFIGSKLRDDKFTFSSILYEVQQGTADDDMYMYIIALLLRYLNSKGYEYKIPIIVSSDPETFFFGENNNNNNLLINVGTTLDKVLSYKTINPGTQTTGSFNPLSELWYYDAYVFNPTKIKHDILVDTEEVDG